MPMHRFLEWTASRFMTKTVKTVTPKVTLRELEHLFAHHDFNAFPVIEDGVMVGFVTKFDFLKAFAFSTSQMLPRYDELMTRQVGEFMTGNVVHVEEGTPLTQVLQLMIKLRARSFPVLDENRQLVGMISRDDLMRALKQSTQGH